METKPNTYLNVPQNYAINPKSDRGQEQHVATMPAVKSNSE